MTRAKLIYSDTMFVVISLIAYLTGGFQKSTLLMAILITFVFAGCMVRHFYYYKMTKRIY